MFVEALEARTLLSGSFSGVDAFSDGLRLVQAVDIDGDGDLDLLGQRKAPDFSTPWAVRLNDGAGGFDALVVLPAASEPFSWVVGVDQDGDGDPDLLARGQSGAVYRVFNDGSGVFDPPELLAGRTLSAFRPLELTAAAGAPQRLVLDAAGNYAVWRFRAGTLETPDFPPLQMSQIAGVADLDGDSDLDVAVRLPGDAEGLMAFVLDEEGAFTRTPDFIAPLVGAGFLDLNGDARGDLWAAAGTELLVATNTGSGVFGPARLVRLRGTREGDQRPLADLNGDGLVDVVVDTLTSVSDGIAVALQRPDGTFEHVAGRPVQPSSARLVELLAADVTGDGRAELIVTFEDPRGISEPLTTQIYGFVGGPVITAITVDARPTTGNLVVRAAVEPSAPGAAVTSLTLYADSNGNGLLDAADRLLGTSSLRDQDGRLVVIVYDYDLPTGDVRLFATAWQDHVVPGGEAAATTNIWTRTFYPEGWRNDTTARERVVLFNPHDGPVPFLLLARYERGTRDGVIAEGTLAPGERRVVVVTNPNRPGLSRVRRNVGYAIELQSERRLAAMLERFDTFGRGPGDAGFGGLIGEHLTDQRSEKWTLPEVHPALNQFILLYNPNPNNVAVRVTFFGPDGVGIATDLLLEPFRRGGLAVADAAGLRGDRAYSVVISTQTTLAVHGRGVVAGISSYDADNGAAYTSLAAASGMGAATDLPIIELGANRTARVAVFNPGAERIQATVRISYDSGAARTFTLSIPALRRAIINPARRAPDGAVAARVQVAATADTVATFFDRARGDSAATTGNRESQAWALAQARVAATGNPSTGDSAVLGLGNAGAAAARVTLRFVFAGGQEVTTRLRLEAGGFRAIPLHTRRFLTAIGGDFSIVVESTRPLTAALSQWSAGPVWGPAPGARGGWWTLGTPLDV